MNDQDGAIVTFSDQNIAESQQEQQKEQQLNQGYDDSPAFLFSVSEPEKKVSDGTIKLGYWSYKLTCNVKSLIFKKILTVI